MLADDCDVAVVGAGAAGLSLALRLARPPAAGRALNAVLLGAPAGPFRTPSRTWCYWEEGAGAYDDALTAVWDRVRVHSRDGTAVDTPLTPYRYKMLRSDDFESFADRLIATDGRVTRAEAVVERIESVRRGAVVHGRLPSGQAVTVRARWVFDSRPPQRLPAARTTLLQHFRGWFVRTRHAVFDPGVVELMDFRTPQPGAGLSFGYVLPTGPHEALVEYTQFSRRPLGREEYDRRLRHYAKSVLALGDHEVVGTEQGVIPMTDARFPRQAAPSVFRIGAAAGATRPSTGYTFGAVQRQTAAVAEALLAGRRPLPPRAHSARSRLMDAVLLHALDRGRVDGAALFTGLFTHVPGPRLLRFLDGRSSLGEDLRIGLRVPVAAMLASAAALPFTPRRTDPGA